MKYQVPFFVFFIFFAVAPCQAQFSRYIIRLKNKTGTPYSIHDPSQFLTQRSINRRFTYNIAVNETDLPITPAYLDSIQSVPNVAIHNVSKWLNQVCIITTDASALARINAFDFVQSSAAIAARASTSIHQKSNRNNIENNFWEPGPLASVNTSDFYDYGVAYNQVQMHNASFLHNMGFRGQGMQMSIIDDGFYRYNSLPTFDSVINNNQILGTWDFVSNNSTVEDDDSHGMRCFSTIAANLPGSFVGTAPAASFYLYRSEDIFSEYPIEEQNWLAAAERADSLGVDVLSVSLGYSTFGNSTFDYTYANMDGNTTTISKGANLATAKGMLVVAAAGNDGNNAWHYISTPGDADSVLTIGAVHANGQPASFSSYGPNSNGQVKPDVAAIGAGAIVAGINTGEPVAGNGTSFACPIMAGIAACLWQAFPEISNMQLMQGLRQSANQFSSPDDRTGYGIPDAKKAFVFFIKQLRSFSAGINQGCNALLAFDIKAAQGMNIVIERKLPSDAGFVPIATQSFSGAFAKRVFTYEDSLDSYTSGVDIQYRIRMTVGTDTSFYTDSVTLAYLTQCNSVTERKVCPGGATYFSVNTESGSTYQWQVDNGNGFVNIANSNIYRGATTHVLVLNNIPPNYYGNKYRCVIANDTASINSTAIALKLSNLWTGAVSAAWENAENWSCGMVPNQYMDVSIPGTANYFPTVSSSASCHSIITSAGASITVSNGNALYIAGQ